MGLHLGGIFEGSYIRGKGEGGLRNHFCVGSLMGLYGGLIFGVILYLNFCVFNNHIHNHILWDPKAALEGIKQSPEVLKSCY